MSITFTPKQLGAVEMIIDWFNNPGKQTFKLGGYAGTGKTTLLRHLLQRIEVPYAVTSFTGKAVSVLKKKGIPSAQTMHSFLYEPHEEKDGTVTFVKRLSFEEQFVANDESSTVSQELNDDLLETGAKILYVGDPGQLEPVGTNPNLMKDCDIVLDEIHRQAANSPILSFATRVRNGEKVVRMEEKNEFGDLLICSPLEAKKRADEVDQVICGFNKTRIEMNSVLRRHYNHTGILQEKEKLICLRNDKNFGVFNGLIVFVDKIISEKSDHFVCTLKTEEGKVIPRIKINKLGLVEGEWNPQNGRIPYEHCIFTYGYCITCHKSQGSEWDSVMILDQAHCKVWTPERWRYTAITRAAKKLIYGI